ncbi:MAG: bifunctional adenosylcobinamide kinase/adenosylcobinamide-phosphate guanylyltransferase [Oscillospiraceae bacterium]|nr:bifunctional adenosylcobinamide kinase/adenosylcobinamide-phosphate guanylyltransferase [Oscillospiraceae bacterium]
MILIFGGVYQGKLGYALERFGLTQSDVYYCSEDEAGIPKDKRIVCGFDRWILALIRADRDVLSAVDAFIKQSGDVIVICDDVSCGVVPVDPQLRQWREETGRAMALVSRESNEVIRLFCSIPTRVK